jgi:MFS family permease
MNEVEHLAAAPRARLFFGWRIVLALFLCTLALFGVSIYSFIVLAHPLGAEYGWSATQTGAAVSAMWFAAPMALLSGPLIKRFNPWHIIFAGLLLQAVGFALLPLISSIEWLYVLRLAMGIGKVTLVTAVPVIVTTWFSRRFATAMAVIWAGGSAGGFIMAPATDALLQAFGWRTAAGIIAAAMVVVVILIGVLARGPASPAALGLAPDGGSQVSASETLPGAASEDATALDWRAALGHVRLWVALPMLLSVMGIGMASIAVLTQEQLVLESAGIASTLAATFLGLTAVGSLIGSASIGLLLDRLPARWSGLLIAGAIYAGLLSFAALQASGSAGLALVAAISCGYAFGAGEVLWITLTKRQFGTAAFATTYGGWYFALQIGYAAGGGVAGWGYERFGAMGFVGLVAIMYIPAALFSLTLRGARLKPGQES